MATILIVEDEPRMRRLLEITLGEDGHNVRSVADAETGHQRQRRPAFDGWVVAYVVSPILGGHLGHRATKTLENRRAYRDMPDLVLDHTRGRGEDGRRRAEAREIARDERRRDDGIALVLAERAPAGGQTGDPQLAATQREAVESLREIHILLADVRDALSQEGGVDQMVRNLSIASDNIARLSSRIERDPTSILKQRAPPNKPTGPPAK